MTADGRPLTAEGPQEDRRRQNDRGPQMADR
jgi:hypothetical protein